MKSILVTSRTCDPLIFSVGSESIQSFAMRFGLDTNSYQISDSVGIVTRNVIFRVVTVTLLEQFINYELN